MSLLMLPFSSESTSVWAVTLRSTTLCLLSVLHFIKTVSHSITLVLYTISRVKQVIYHLFSILKTRKLSGENRLVISVIYRKFKLRISDSLASVLFMLCSLFVFWKPLFFLFIKYVEFCQIFWILLKNI